MAGPSADISPDDWVNPIVAQDSTLEASAATEFDPSVNPTVMPGDLPRAGFNPVPSAGNLPSTDVPGPAFARGGAYESPTFPWRPPAPVNAETWMGEQPDLAKITREAAGIAGLSAKANEESNARNLAKLRADSKLQENYFNAEAFEAGNMPKPWDADKEAEKRFTGPFEKFGNIGVIFAGIASAFSRQPMTAALNASAAAMNAIHDSDVEGYKRAYTAWKDNTELAVKRFNMQHTLFNDTQHLFNTDAALWKAENEAIASKFKDAQMLNLLRNGMYGEAMDLMDKRNKLIQGTREQLFKGELFEQRREAWQAQRDEIDKRFDPKNRETYQKNIYTSTLLREEYEAKTPEERSFWRMQREYMMKNGEPMPQEEQVKLWDDLKYHLSGKESLITAKALTDQDKIRLRAELKAAESKLTREAKTELEAKKNEYKTASDERRAQMRKNEFEMSADLKRELQEKGIDSKEWLAAFVQGKLDERQTERLEAAQKRVEFTTNAKKEMQGLSIEARKEIEEMRQEGADRRTELSAKTRMEIANLSAKTRKEIYDQQHQPMSDAAINSLVERTLAGEPNSAVLRSVGYGRQREANLNKYNDALAKAMEERGLTPETLNLKQAQWQGNIAAGRAAGGAETRALSNSLNQVVMMNNAFEQYERSMLRQLDVLVDLGRKVDVTGIPAIERWIRAGRQATGDPDVADFHLQWNLVSTEAARAIVSPRLVGVLTDNARHEMQQSLPKAASVPQLERVASRLHADADIRRDEIGNQITTIKEQLESGHVRVTKPDEYTETKTLNGRKVGKKRDGSLWDLGPAD